MKHFSRRSLLNAVGKSAALLPFLPILEARAAGNAPPKRLIFLYSSNGTVHERWVPTMSNGTLVLSDILKPLEDYKSQLLVVDGLGYNVLQKADVSGHEGGITTALTGAINKKTDPSNNDSALSMGISVDQQVANAIGQNTKFRSLECGIQVDTFANTLSSLSYRGPKQPQPPENDPYKIFDRIFGGFTPPGGQAAAPDPKIEQLRLDRKSVLDSVTAELTSLQPKLGTQEQQKVQAHLEAVRDLEKRLTSTNGNASASATASCSIPDKGTKLEVLKNDNIPALGKLQMDMLVMAMACDLTRVGTIQYGRGGANHRLSWLGPEFLSDPDNGPNDSTGGIHALAHNESNQPSRDKLVKCHAWYASQVKYLVDRLKAVPEGAGTMADNTMVVWMNELGTGNHQVNNTPWVVVGGVGALRTGRVVSFPGKPHNGLLVSICQAMGLPDTQFGDAEFSNGPLSGLT